jgi:hypothetical protein
MLQGVVEVGSLTELRWIFDLTFSEATAYPGSWDPKIPSKGHCAVVAKLVQELCGGKLVSLLTERTVLQGVTVGRTRAQRSKICVDLAIEKHFCIDFQPECPYVVVTSPK